MIWSNPCCRSRSMRNSMTGLLTIGIIGFGTVSVTGRTRVPLPAASSIAFIGVLREALDGLIDRGKAREHSMQPDDLQHSHHRRLNVGQPEVAVALEHLERLQGRDERTEARAVDEGHVAEIDDHAMLPALDQLQQRRAKLGGDLEVETIVGRLDDGRSIVRGDIDLHDLRLPSARRPNTFVVRPRDATTSTMDSGAACPSCGPALP